MCSSPSTSAFPAGASRPQIRVNGGALPARADDKGFVKIARTWSGGDTVEMQVPDGGRGFSAVSKPSFRPQTAVISASSRRLSSSPGDCPYASVLYGPLLFALPIPDIDPNTPVKDAKWQFALDLQRCQGIEHGNAGQNGTLPPGSLGIAVERKPMPAHWDWPLDSPLRLTAPAQAFDWKPSDAQALPDQPVAGAKPETIRLVPYGCTKFRISMFPVAAP